MKYKVIPTVFTKNKKDFNIRSNKLIKVSKDIQIDFMDGKFVRAKSVSVSEIPNLSKLNNNFEAHLMTSHPVKYIKKLKEKGFKKVIFHYNTGDNVKIIAEIRKAGMKAFLALNPEAKIKKVRYLFDLVDGILLMGHVPGKEHLQLQNSTFEKIKDIRKINKNIDIQIDGGVNIINIAKLKKAGANIFNIGSFVAKSGKPKEIILNLKKELKV